MSTLEQSLSWLERVADRANPILVKETRQALKSRQFVVTFMLMLGVSWFIFAIGLLTGGTALEYGAVGDRFFWVLYWPLAIAVMIVVPFTAQRSLLAERDQATYDLLSITTLTPSQIVWGKLLSALVQSLIFYSAIAPFIAFTSLLQGFDFVYVAAKLVLTLLLSLFVTMAAIASSTMVKQRQWQALATIGGLGAIAWLATTMLAGLESLLQSFDPADLQQWAGLTFAMVMGASYFVLFHKIATAQLTFESDDRSSGIRIVCSAQFFLVWIGLLVLAWLSGGSSLDEDVIVTAIILSALHLAIVGLFIATEDSFLSRRVRRNLPDSRFRRLIHVPFLQGASRGYLYVLLHVGVYALLSVGSSLAYVGHTNWSAAVPLAISAYLMIYLGIATALARGLQRLSSDIRPGHTRVLMIILLAIACIAPYIPLLWINQFRYSYSVLQITEPISTCAHIADSGEYSGAVLILLAAASGLIVLLNLRAIKDGIAEVVVAEVPTRKLASSSPPPESTAQAVGATAAAGEAGTV
jgi:hypothetical protein